MPRSFTEREKENIKRSLQEALKLIYREYDKNNFLYDSDSTDFTILMNKDILLQNHMETFDFIVDHLIDSLYE